MSNLKDQLRSHYQSKSMDGSSVDRLLSRGRQASATRPGQSWLRVAAVLLLLAATAWTGNLYLQNRRDDLATMPHPVKLVGEVKCAACILHQQFQCERVLETMEGGKSVVYRLEPNEVNQAFRGNTCQRSYKMVALGNAHRTKGVLFLTPEKLLEVQRE